MTLEPPPGFIAAAEELGVAFDPGDVDRLGRFLALMLEVNKTHNLTAITDPAEAWTRHILDAISVVPLIASVEPAEAGSPVRVCDIGAGGGVPGIPLAILLPEVRFTLVEATGKKVEFLRSAVAELGLENVAVVGERAERVGQDHRAHREKYDVALARAVGHLAIVVELCAPLVRPGGVVLAIKGAKAEQEIEQAGKAMGLLGVRLFQTVPTPTGRIVVLEKTTRTPRDYPRRDGEPKRRPLGMPAPERT
ncbi:MAG: 16S rRNA (guanine(527)-N(7))-methyltransferase RsmG [Phycisphaeraceae bacterium]|nr:16S rRNA (guanine(527)-N(7))-methyltransferase RsmG [Phycisphaeraceae bacterium]